MSSRNRIILSIILVLCCMSTALAADQNGTAGYISNPMQELDRLNTQNMILKKKIEYQEHLNKLRTLDMKGQLEGLSLDAPPMSLEQAGSTEPYERIKEVPLYQIVSIRGTKGNLVAEILYKNRNIVVVGNGDRLPGRAVVASIDAHGVEVKRSGNIEAIPFKSFEEQKTDSSNKKKGRGEDSVSDGNLRLPNIFRKSSSKDE